MTTTDERLPWDRQPGETRRQYAAFKAFRDLGEKRSIRRIARVSLATRAEHRRDGTRPDSLELASLGAVAEWHKRWDWAARADAWDRHLDGLQVAERERKAVEAVQQHDALASHFLNLVARWLVGDELAGIEPADASKLKPGEVIRMFAEAVRTQRLTRGEPTEIAQQQGPGGGPVVAHMKAAPKDAEAMIAMYQGLEDLGDFAPGTTQTIKAALVAMGQLADEVDEADGS